jgi:hypothetical protein
LARNLQDTDKKTGLSDFPNRIDGFNSSYILESENICQDLAEIITVAILTDYGTDAQLARFDLLLRVIGFYNRHGRHLGLDGFELAEKLPIRHIRKMPMADDTVNRVGSEGTDGIASVSQIEEPDREPFKDIRSMVHSYR